MMMMIFMLGNNSNDNVDNDYYVRYDGNDDGRRCGMRCKKRGK